MSGDSSLSHLDQRNERQEELMMQPDPSEPLKRAAIYARSYQLKPSGGTNSIQARNARVSGTLIEQLKAIGLATEAEEKY